MIDSIVDAVMDIPRLETKLYLDWGTVELLKVSILQFSLDYMFMWEKIEFTKDFLNATFSYQLQY